MELSDVFRILSLTGHINTFDLSPLLCACKEMNDLLDISADLNR